MLLCLPMIGFGQDKNLKKSKFNFNKSNNYLDFIRKQLEERKLFNYPPYSRLIGITLKHKNQRRLDDAALQLVIQIRKSFGDRVLGPEYPVIARIRNYYHKNVLLKIEQKGSVTEAKHILQSIIDSMQNHSDFKSVRFMIDVDPI